MQSTPKQLGGFRPEHHQRPTHGPIYKRCREFPTTNPLVPEPWRRSNQWAWRYRLHIWSAVEDGSLSLTTASVAIVISRHADKQGCNAWPGRKRIGAKLGGMSPRTVTRHTGKLVKAGWLAKVHRHEVTPDGVRGRSNLYQLMMPPEVEALVPADRPAAKRQRPAQPPAGPPRILTELQEPVADQRLVDLWKSALEALDPEALGKLAAEHLPTIIAGRPGAARTSALASELAAIGPP